MYASDVGTAKKNGFRTMQGQTAKSCPGAEWAHKIVQTAALPPECSKQRDSCRSNIMSTELNYVHM
jgi:hypothetical protein